LTSIRRITGSKRSWLFAAWLLIAFMFAAARSVAQSNTDDSRRTSARQLGTEGIEAFRANDFAAADDKLDRAFRLYPTPTLGLWSGRARLQQGHLVEAAARFREATEVPETVGDSAPQKQAQLDAAGELKALTSRIPTLTIELEAALPNEVIVTVDGALQSVRIGTEWPLNPGPHHLTAARGGEHYEVDLLLAERDRKKHVFKFRAVNAPQPVAAVSKPEPEESQAPVESTAANESTTASEPTSDLVKPIAIGALVFGGVGLATSGITALLANGKLDKCPNHLCESLDSKSSYETLKTLSTVSFYVGAAFAVGGFVTLLIAPSSGSPSPERISWGVGPGSLQMQGAF
jgi:hypothetical protein